MRQVGARRRTAVAGEMETTPVVYRARGPFRLPAWRRSPSLSSNDFRARTGASQVEADASGRQARKDEGPGDASGAPHGPEGRRENVRLFAERQARNLDLTEAVARRRAWPNAGP